MNLVVVQKNRFTIYDWQHMRVLVCGGRDFALPEKSIEASNQRSFIWNYLTQVNLGVEPIEVLIHGGAVGVDRCAGQWAHNQRITVREFIAQWDKYDKSAGPIRNQQMLDEGKPDLVIAFPGGRGTADMVRRAKKAGVKVDEVFYNQ